MPTVAKPIPTTAVLRIQAETIRGQACGALESMLNPRMRSFRHLLDRAEMLVPPLPWDRPCWRDCGGPPVVLLHGLWRGWHAMEPLARTLGREGFSTLNLPYPSTRMGVPELAQMVGSAVEKNLGRQPVHFVTHSLGGIIARALIDRVPEWQAGRLIMLAPPNGGSEIVDWSTSHPLLHRLLGPAGRALGTGGIPGQLPPLPQQLQTMVIMGRRASIPCFGNLLETDNDGIVSVSRGHIAGLAGFAVIDADHTFIQTHPDAVRLTVDFLKTGRCPA